MDLKTNDKDNNDSSPNDDHNENGEVIRDSLNTRSLRPSTTAATSTAKLKQRKEEKGVKRKYVINHSSSASKIPKYENITVCLEAKTIILSEKALILDRKKLTTIPPKEGSFGVGDLIWAKMQGYPWWPCMITIDPITGEFFKNSSSSFKADIVYHIQYFGAKPYRGWTTIGMILPFEGYDKFRDMIENEMFDLDKKKRAKVEAKYFVRGSMLKKWNESVSEAEEALLLDIKERVNKLTFNYINVAPQKSTTSNKNPKISNSHNNLNSSKKSSTTGDVYNFEDDDDASDTTFPEFVLRKRVQKADYNVYFEKNLDEEMLKHPELTRTQIKNKLKKQWDNLDDELRSLYVERKALYEDESNMLVSKRSNFDDDYFNDESDYEYNDNDTNSDTNHVVNNCEDSKADATMSNSVKKRRIKSKKSEKLFDKIKNNDMENKNDTINDDSKLKKRKSKADLNETNGSKDKKPRRSLKIKTENNGETEKDCSSDISISDSSDKKTAEFCFQCGYLNKKDILANCSGKCGRRYHLNCCKDTSMVKIEGKKYLCQECIDGKFKCCYCKDEEDLNTKKCEIESCNKYYHLRCIESCPIEVNEIGNTFKCPSHKCINCFEMKIDGNQNKGNNNKKLLKCIRCPLAFHNTPICISAGMVMLTDEYVICPDHYSEFNTNRLNRHINVNLCMSCLKVGELICCEKCPLAFHEDCLGYKIDPNKCFYCTNCLTHKQMHHDDVVWVKLGSYRWWPGRIKNPTEVPKNVSNVKYQYCQFPVYFFGTHDYYWINKGRSFLFVEGDANSPQKIYNGTKKLQNEFNLAIEEAKEEHKNWIVTKAEKIRQSLKAPLPYQTIHSNRYLTNKIFSNNELNRHICDCKKEMAQPCSNDNCLNRISLIECDPKYCPAGDKCQNQSFRKNKYANVETFRTLHTGWGLRPKENLRKGQFIIEYLGDVIDEQECRRRLNESQSSNFYFFTLDKDNIIDAGPRGNLSRFINHSCNPNCTTQKWMVNNRTRIGIFALKDIAAGTELTFNYNLDCWGNENVECRCQSENCSGFIGQRAKDDPKRLMNDSKNGKNKNSTSA